ncbi:MAG TPA: sodium:proton antiporter, partial [Hellea balneolensis]|nr:sodium:proton antiporter [Hellea balneolensis]
WLLAWSFRRGMVPEYLKAPVVLIWVLFIYVMANQIAEETGLLAVTAMGVAMANTKFAAMQEMRRFKENIAILLVSGVFVVLSASLNPEVLRGIDLKVLLFVLAMMLVVRPIAVFASTLWSGLNWRETTLVALIAPRGIVAVAVAGLFATELGQIGRVDGAIFVPLAFALVFATVLTSGFIIGPLTRALGLAKDKNEGVMIVGANPWSLGLARALKDMGVPVLVADTNWRRLRGARQEGLDVFYGEVLSENADHRLDHSRFGTLIAATPNDAYNALVCVEFAPELGRHRVFQLAGPDREEDDNRAITYTARGRTLNTKGKTFDMLTRDWWSGWRFKVTGLGEEFGLEDFLRERGGDVLILMARRPDGTLDFQTPERTARSGSVTVLSFGPLAPASKYPEAAQDGGKATAQPA